MSNSLITLFNSPIPYLSIKSRDGSKSQRYLLIKSFRPFNYFVLNYICLLLAIYYIIQRLNHKYVQDTHNYARGLVQHQYERIYWYTVEKLVSDVFENPNVWEKTAGQLIKLVQIPRIEKLMTNIMITMLFNDGFNKSTYALFQKIIVDYLRSDHWLEKTTDLGMLFLYILVILLITRKHIWYSDII